MLTNILIFSLSLYAIVKGALLSTKYIERFSKNIQLSKNLIRFILISFISAMPETFIAINSALNHVSSFGLGTLFSSNVANLLLVLPVAILITRKEIRIDNRVLKKHLLYLGVLLLPLLLGLDGNFSRIDGIILLVLGTVFYFRTVEVDEEEEPKKKEITKKKVFKNVLLVLFSIGILLLGAHFVVTSASFLANSFGVDSITIGILLVGLGAAIPELSLSLGAINKKHGILPIDGILGSILVNSTILIGVIALINPFSFPLQAVYNGGLFMLLGTAILFRFMKTSKVISYKEAAILFSLWLVFIAIEFFVIF